MSGNMGLQGDKCSPGEEFLVRVLRPYPLGCVHNRYQGKRHAGRKCLYQCPIHYHEGKAAVTSVCEDKTNLLGEFGKVTS